MKRKKTKVINNFVTFMLALTMFLTTVIGNVNIVSAEDYGTAITIANGTDSPIYCAVTRHSGGNHDWQEYGFTVKNNTNETLNGVTITIPTNGSITAFQSWKVSAKYSNGSIVITYTDSLAPGANYTCSNDDKFGFSGGGTLSTPSASAGADAAAASGLKYSVTGSTKTLSYENTPVGMHGSLSVANAAGYSAPTIVDENGNAVLLRGASTHGIQWFPEYINKAGFQSLRDEWGINTIRMAVYPKEGGYLEGKQSSMDAKIQEGVKAAQELGMYVIIDWHVLSYNPNNTINEAKTFFKKYATMYKDYDNVIFEICNEPTGTPWYNGSSNDLYSYCTTVSKVIRDCGSDAIIICGTNDWSQRVDEVSTKPLSSAGFKNIMYSIHYYAASHYDSLKNNVKTAIASGTPVFASEFGCCDASGGGSYDFDNATDWMNLLTSNNISFNCWSLTNKSEAASYLSSSCNKTSGWTANDLTDTGIWLINTCRALEENESTVTPEPTPEPEPTPVEPTPVEPAPVEPAPVEPEPTPVEPAPVDTVCTAEISSNDWGCGLGAGITISNTSSASVSDWTLEFDFAGEITNIWCASIESHVGNHYVIRPASFNSTIPASSQISFGFNATKDASTDASITNISVK